MAKRMMFVNLPVKDLGKSVDFFKGLGFTFDPRFTDEKATCMIVGSDCYVMLLVEGFFRGFIPGKEISDAAKNAEVLVALSAGSRKDVDGMISKAVAGGGSEYRKAQDLGYMYSRAFQDINGHLWEVIYMDMDSLPEDMKRKGRK
jgi:predicted lactoylglutathione lyase